MIWEGSPLAVWLRSCYAVKEAAVSAASLGWPPCGVVILSWATETAGRPYQLYGVLKRNRTVGIDGNDIGDGLCQEESVERLHQGR